jgi:hypothetical protein
MTYISLQYDISTTSHYKERSLLLDPDKGNGLIDAVWIPAVADTLYAVVKVSYTDETKKTYSPKFFYYKCFKMRGEWEWMVPGEIAINSLNNYMRSKGKSF